MEQGHLHGSLFLSRKMLLLPLTHHVCPQGLDFGGERGDSVDQLFPLAGVLHESSLIPALRSIFEATSAFDSRTDIFVRGSIRMYSLRKQQVFCTCYFASFLTGFSVGWRARHVLSTRSGDTTKDEIARTHFPYPYTPPPSSGETSHSKEVHLRGRAKVLAV